MVVVHVLEKGSSKYRRESFIDPRHYIKWRELHARKLVDIKPVRSGR